MESKTGLHDGKYSLQEKDASPFGAKQPKQGTIVSVSAKSFQWGAQILEKSIFSGLWLWCEANPSSTLTRKAITTRRKDEIFYGKSYNPKIELKESGSAHPGRSRLSGTDLLENCSFVFHNAFQKSHVINCMLVWLVEGFGFFFV